LRTKFRRSGCIEREEVSGADVSERIDELFADSAAKTVPPDESGLDSTGTAQVESDVMKMRLKPESRKSISAI
jgi:hypothetical protein